jgi:hypothetical protein
LDKSLPAVLRTAEPLALLLYPKRLGYGDAS